MTTNTHTNQKRKASFIDRFMSIPKDTRASIICGLLSINGSASMSSLYKTLME